MSTLQAELRRIRKHLEATRKKLPSSPEMPEDSEVTLTFVGYRSIHDFDGYIMTAPKGYCLRKRLDQEQLASEKQAKSWDEHKESK